jgi:small ligand-binding sensory domain FIST
MRWSSSVSEDPDTERAVCEAAGRIRQELEGLRADLLFLFASEHHRAAGGRLAELAQAACGGGLLVGCNARSVIGAGRELEDQPGLSLTAAVLPGVTVQPLHVAADSLPEDASAWRERLGLGPQPAPHFVLLADPLTFDAERLAQSLDAAFPQSVKVGGLASGGVERGHTALYLGSELRGSGAIAVALQGDLEVDAIVAQGCRPIGVPMFVTACRGNVLLELDARRPLEVLQEHYEKADTRDRELMRSSLFLGIEMRPQQGEYRQGDFLIRNLIGMDPESGALAVGARLAPGQVVQFHLRDARTSAEDLERRLLGYARERGSKTAPGGALLFSCLGRGAQLYGRSHHDSNAFRERIGNIPLGGFFCNGEIGPVQRQTFLHGYTSAFGIFRPRS